MNIYAISLRLWPVYVPCLIEETLIVTLTVMKFVYAKNDLLPDASLKCTASVDERGNKAPASDGRIPMDETERVDAEGKAEAADRSQFENDERV